MTDTLHKELSVFIIYLYCRTVQFEDSLSIANQRTHKLYINLKFITLKHLKRSNMFRSLDHPQGGRIFPC
jgi:hypothetical protein